MNKIITQLTSKINLAFRIMMLLDNQKLFALEEEFNDHPDGIG